MARFEEKRMTLGKNRAVSFFGKKLWIKSDSGWLYITWLACPETILAPGEQLEIRAAGKICVLACTDATFRFRKEHTLDSIWRRLPWQRITFLFKNHVPVGATVRMDNGKKVSPACE